jgi:hypothetical protein
MRQVHRPHWNVVIGDRTFCVTIVPPSMVRLGQSSKVDMESGEILLAEGAGFDPAQSFPRVARSIERQAMRLAA